MEIKNFTITKRDGSKDRFSLDKIMNAIVKAFESVNVPADLGSSPMSVAMFLCSTLALASYFEPVAALTDST